MKSSSIGMGSQSETERKNFESELKRIIEASDRAGLLLRVIGSLAFQLHCPQYGYLQAAMGRAYTDIDFAAYRRHSREIKLLMAGLGYIENREVSILSEGSRSIYENQHNRLHLDIFYDKLDFCHVIYWEGRLEADAPTIPLSELLLEKMQIVRINEKDIIDTIMLLLEHPLGEIDQETINIAQVSRLCALDWGLWRTTTMNLDKVAHKAFDYPQLDDAHKNQVASKVKQILSSIETEPKSMAWRLRSRVGDRVKWYKDVDEVHS